MSIDITNNNKTISGNQQFIHRGCKPKPSEFPGSARQFLDALGKASERFFHVL
jgi:hypothetical protein